MLVKVFEAPEMSTALKMVKETLGPDALILSTRTLRKGGMGVFGKPILEITAAVESPAMAGAPQLVSADAVRPALATSDDDGQELDYRDIWRRSTVVDANERVTPLTQSAFKDNSGESLAVMRNELDELKGMLRQVVQGTRSDNGSSFSSIYSLAGEAGWLQTLLGRLAHWGIDADGAEAIVRRAQEKLTPGQLGEPVQLQHFLQATLGDMARVTGPIFTGNRQQQRLALVGPTGVGKTTTLAKLAADYLSNFAGTVAFVTIDTYRIAAVEQLKVYGEIMGLPVEVVFAPDELQTAFARHADKDLILVDTAGRSPRDDQRLDELVAFLGPQSETRNHLVLPAPTGSRELQEIVRRFSRLNLDSVIFTKLDECQDHGCLLNIPVRQNLPVSYLTNGQRVPEDLLAAQPAIIADYVMGLA